MFICNPLFKKHSIYVELLEKLYLTENYLRFFLSTDQGIIFSNSVPKTKYFLHFAGMKQLCSDWAAM